MWDECNCAVVSAIFGISFLWDLNENWPFPVLWLLLSFPILLVYWVHHFNSIFYDLKFLNWNSITSWQIDAETMETVRDFILGAPKSLQMVIAAMKLKEACSLEERYDKPRQHIKKQRHYFANKGLSSQDYDFSSSHAWMWELDYKESWALKNWCFWTVMLEKTLESPLDSKEIQQVHPKGNQSWIFIRRTDAEAETPIPWPPDVNNWLIGKDPDAGKDWRREKGMTQDEMVGWHHWLYGREFE